VNRRGRAGFFSTVEDSVIHGGATINGFRWVRNLRAAGEGDLLLGRRREHFHAAEIADTEREEIIRAYLRRWKWEVGQFFSGVGPDASSAELERIAPDHPIFRIDA
jgi:hypothetical protein